MTALIVLASLGVLAWACAQLMAWALLVVWLKGPFTLALYLGAGVLALRIVWACCPALARAIGRLPRRSLPYDLEACGPVTTWAPPGPTMAETLAQQASHVALPVAADYSQLHGQPLIKLDRSRLQKKVSASVD